MTFNIRAFKSVLNSVNGLVKANKFQVLIVPKLQLGDIRTITFLCDQATLPGVAWTTQDVRHTGYGNFAKRPTNATFSDVTLGFFVDSNSNVMEFFHRWMSNINNFDRSNPGERNGLPLYQFNYPEEYEAVVEITTFDDENFPVTTIKLNDAFPVSVADQQLSWENQNSLLRMQVTLAYDSWSSNHFDETQANRSTDRSGNQFNEAPLIRQQRGETFSLDSDVPLPPQRQNLI